MYKIDLFIAYIKLFTSESLVCFFVIAKRISHKFKKKKRLSYMSKMSQILYFFLSITTGLNGCA